MGRDAGYWQYFSPLVSDAEASLAFCEAACTTVA